MIAFTEKGRYRLFKNRIEKLSKNFTNEAQTVSIDMKYIVAYGCESSFLISGLARIKGNEGTTFEARILKKICTKTATKRQVRQSFLREVKQFLKANSR